MIINRNGYGSNFNEITINNNLLIKKIKNDYGKEKIKNEINFYNSIKTIDFPTPTIIEMNINKYYIIMEYLKEYNPLYKLFNDLDDSSKNEILNLIKFHLNKLHKIIIPIKIKLYNDDLINETISKIDERMKNVEFIIKKYSFIKKINNKIFIPFSKIKNEISKNIYNHINNNKYYFYSIIHGDCQFNNILINNKDIKFIDPRGYYNNSKVYGLKEYDLAKIDFALSGYDVFDNSIISKLDIDNDNININDIYLQQNKHLLSKNILINTLTATIWFGNSHIFKDNEYKCIYSYFMAINFSNILF